ncbi:MAG: Gfo/Idh/MocA family oxidoreductase, partial [Planctomycetes bacterium]|nr:Gfo/Idh/MocA family oxidoreductase [Planctomycetota bacterium]
MTDLRFGILGSGGRGRFAAHAHKPGEGSKVVACCDVKDFVLEQNKEAYGADCFTTTDVETFIGQDMDGVFICTPDFLHEEQAVACLDAGFSVYLEKPMAISIEGCDRVLAAAERSKGKLFVGHNMRYMTIIRKMKQLIDDGAIGTVKSVWCRHFISYGGDAYFRDWHTEQRYTNSLLLQKGAHDIDVMHWLTGSNTTRVSAFGNNAVYNQL